MSKNSPDNEYSKYLTPDVVEALGKFTSFRREGVVKPRKELADDFSPDNDVFFREYFAFFFEEGQNFSPDELKNLQVLEIQAIAILGYIAGLIWTKTPSVQEDFLKTCALGEQKTFGESVSKAIDAELRFLKNLSLPLEIRRVMRELLMGRFYRLALDFTRARINEQTQVVDDTADALLNFFNQRKQLTNLQNSGEREALIQEMFEFCTELVKSFPPDYAYLRKRMFLDVIGKLFTRVNSESLKVLQELRAKFLQSNEE